MSFQGLISGSECAAPANPLSQVLKHTDNDRSLQQDRIAGPSSSRLQQLPGTSSTITASEQDVAFARQFFETNSGRPGMAQEFLPAQQLELMRMAQAQASSPAMHAPWAMEQSQQMPKYEAPTHQSAWAAEFSNVPQSNSSGPVPQKQSTQMPGFQQRPSYMPQMYAGSMSGMGMQGVGLAGMQYSNSLPTNAGKGKAREVDFEAAFAQFAESMGIQESNSKIEEVDEVSESTMAKVEEALKNTSLIADQSQEDYETSFQKMWEELRNSDVPPPQEDMAKWEAEFSQLMNAQRDELEDYGKNMQQAYENDVRNPSDDAIRFDEEGIPQLGDYVFEKNNRYLDPSASSRSLLDEAKALLDQNGSLSEAALMLEAAIQRGELGEGGYEAWILLGETRNMDEREEAGIRGLIEGVKRAGEAPGAASGMLSLAISFTNENMDKGSHTMLLRWFRARYPEVPIPQEVVEAVKSSMAWSTHEKLTELFVGLARAHHTEGKMDDDLQVALGVLFYTVGEYNRAQDCFSAALSVRPKDYLLWNRLGSAMSNDRKPEEALGAYREALQLRPTYTRAIYNVGVACLNIGADKEAAEHFLSALSLQESSGTSSDTSDTLWSTLRKALYSMNRNDLAEIAQPAARANLDIFRKEGFDF